MPETNIYQDIAARTGGDIYIGVVGPVRTGKSTFIKKFMEMLIIPGIEDSHEQRRAIDELPQSSSGRTIMTTEPKFIPNQAVDVAIGKDGTGFKAKMIDCVGYVVPSALGHMEDGMNRMVKTPWSDEEIPFVQAAEIGTRKVITEHSTIGIVVTTDGTITEIPREDYREAEARVVRELKEMGKPFVILMNTVDPSSKECLQLCKELSDQYNAKVLPVNCQKLQREDIDRVMEQLLEEFPLREIRIFMPKWFEILPMDHPLKQELIGQCYNNMHSLSRLRDAASWAQIMEEHSFVRKVHIDKPDAATGCVDEEVVLEEGLFYDVLSDTTGLAIHDEKELFTVTAELAEAKKEYEKLASAYKAAMSGGYGIVNPLIEEVKLEEPRIVKQGGKYGVMIQAKAPSVHLIRTDVVTELNPFVGTKAQSEDFIAYWKEQLETEPDRIWELEIFGRSLMELTDEGMRNKLLKLPEDARRKLQHTLERLVNEGRGGLICIIL